MYNWITFYLKTVESRLSISHLALHLLFLLQIGIIYYSYRMNNGNKDLRCFNLPTFLPSSLPPSLSLTKKYLIMLISLLPFIGKIWKYLHSVYVSFNLSSYIHTVLSMTKMLLEMVLTNTLYSIIY